MIGLVELSREPMRMHAVVPQYAAGVNPCKAERSNCLQWQAATSSTHLAVSHAQRSDQCVHTRPAELQLLNTHSIARKDSHYDIAPRQHMHASSLLAFCYNTATSLLHPCYITAASPLHPDDQSCNVTPTLAVIVCKSPLSQNNCRSHADQSHAWTCCRQYAHCPRQQRRLRDMSSSVQTTQQLALA